jgi:hypothetical protein
MSAYSLLLSKLVTDDVFSMLVSIPDMGLFPLRLAVDDTMKIFEYLQFLHHKMLKAKAMQLYAFRIGRYLPLLHPQNYPMVFHYGYVETTNQAPLHENFPSLPKEIEQKPGLILKIRHTNTSITAYLESEITMFSREIMNNYIQTLEAAFKKICEQHEMAIHKIVLQEEKNAPHESIFEQATFNF